LNFTANKSFKDKNKGIIQIERYVKMTTKAPIKVIKRDERTRQEANADQTAPTVTTQQAAREMVANVSTWVSEFQQKRRTETSEAIKHLFADTTAQPTEA